MLLHGLPRTAHVNPKAPAEVGATRSPEGASMATRIDGSEHGDSVRFVGSDGRTGQAQRAGPLRPLTISRALDARRAGSDG